MSNFTSFCKHGTALNKFLLSYISQTDLSTHKVIDLHSLFQTVPCKKINISPVFGDCKLTKLAESKAGIPYLVQCDNLTFVLKQLPYRKRQHIKPHLTEINSNGDACYFTTQQNNNTAHAYTFGSQGFVNEYLIGVLVAYTLQKAKSVNFLPFYRGFYCKGQGYILMEHVTGECSSIPKHKKLTRKLLISVLLQFCQSLLILKRQLQFSHNDLKLKNLFFLLAKTPPRNWDSSIPWANIIIKFADFDKSTCVVKNENYPVFLYPTHRLISSVRGVLTNTVQRRFDSTASKYKIKYSGGSMAFNSRNARQPYFKSFDFYVFFTSMLLNSDYRTALQADFDKSDKESLLRTIIFPLYGFESVSNYEETFQKFKKKLKKGEEDSVSSAMKFLRNRELYCNAIENTFTRLRKLSI
jgi:hypothetical protein